MDSESPRGDSQPGMKVIIQDDEGHRKVFPFVGAEVTIGRHESNTIPLPERNVSRRHARLTRQNGHVLVEDLGSYNGIFINGERIRSTVPVRDGDQIRIGDYDVAVLQDGASLPAHVGPSSSGGNAKTVELKPPAVPTASLSPSPLGPAPEGAPGSARGEAPPQAEEGPPQDLDPATAPRLVVLNAPFAGREFACIRTVLRIGRADDASNDISIDHRSLSRVHAKLVQGPSGQWRVVDLQSANGLLINGEKYGEGAVSGGDVITLGQVRMKFLLPGDRFTFVPEEVLSRRGTLKRALALAAALAVAGAVLSYTRFRPESPVTRALGLLRAKAKAGLAARERGTDALAEARAALARHDFAAASAALGRAQSSDEASQHEALILFTEAEREATVQKALASARAALAAGKAADAEGMLQGLRTELQARELAELKARVQAALRGGAASSDAEKLFETGKAALREHDYPKAMSDFDQCLKADPSYLHCEAYLGAAYIGLGQGEQGALHYRHFAEHAPPGDESYRHELDQVRQRLQQYDQELKHRSRDLPGHRASGRSP